MPSILFWDAQGEWKLLKRGRERDLPLLALALLEHDEIWMRVEWFHAQGRAVVRRHYVARFMVEGQETHGPVVFELGSGGWTGVTAFPPEPAAYVEDLRVGVRLYRREEGRARQRGQRTATR